MLYGVMGDFLIVFLSILIVHVPLIVSGRITFEAKLMSRLLWSHVTESDLGIVLLYGALITLVAYSEKMFETSNRCSGVELAALFKSVAWPTLLVTVATRLSGGGSLTPTMLFAAGGLNLAGMRGRRAWNRRLGRKTQGQKSRRVLIVGAGYAGRAIAEELASRKELQKVVCGFLDERGADGADVLGDVDDLSYVARTVFADEVIVALPENRELAMHAILEAKRNHLDVKIVPDLMGCNLPVVHVEHLAASPLISLHQEPIPEFGLFIKRTLDVLLSATALMAAAPFMAAIAIIIKLDSPGPIFYRAFRAGKKGQHFRCCKFRTMACDADLTKDGLRASNQREGPTFKMVRDPRITRVGRFLRRYSLDELPQLWNVLKGEMSLVGPRPHPLDDYSRYELEHLRRLDVMPGITGLWQVTARRDPSFRRNMALDLEYIETWSLWMDFRILFRTFSAVVSGSGA